MQLIALSWIWDLSLENRVFHIRTEMPILAFSSLLRENKNPVTKCYPQWHFHIVCEKFECHSWVASAISTLQQVSMGKLIDTCSPRESVRCWKTVECPLHVQDLKAIDQSPYRNRQFGGHPYPGILYHIYFFSVHLIRRELWKKISTSGHNYKTIAWRARKSTTR